MSGLPTVRELLASRAGEEMVLNDRYLNPQMGRILRTLGFDKRWVGGDSTHLIDSDGERYLDLLSGYGVFALGRNHPDVVEAVHDVLQAGTANLPQLGVTLLSGVLAEQLLARAPASVAAMVPANTGADAVETAIKIARAATGRRRAAVCRARVPRADARRAVAQRQRRVSVRLRAAAARLRPGPVRRCRRARARAGARETSQP